MRFHNAGFAGAGRDIGHFYFGAAQSPKTLPNTVVAFVFRSSPPKRAECNLPLSVRLHEFVTVMGDLQQLVENGPIRCLKRVCASDLDQFSGFWKTVEIRVLVNSEAHGLTY